MSLSNAIGRFTRSTSVLRLRSMIAAFRNRYDPYFQIRNLKGRICSLEANFYYEMESPGLWQPKILGLEETLRYVIDHRCSMARYGDGEFELMAGRNMSFELANQEMKHRLEDILANPLSNCLNCVPNIFGSLVRYRQSDIRYWRGAALWMRPILKRCVCGTESGGGAQNAILGDAQVSRAYLGVGDDRISAGIFDLWMELFACKRLLIVEGRFSRLGVGNDLFAGAVSIKRIWCPANGAYSRYGQILSTIRQVSDDVDLIVLALGATATILAYDLAKEGRWALDVGHIDVEYMWMKMGVREKTPIPGRYVNECVCNGREQKRIEGEEVANHVIRVIE